MSHKLASPQLLDQSRKSRIVQIVQNDQQCRGRIGLQLWFDGGSLALLPDSIDHKLHIRTGNGDVVLTILAYWFREPNMYKNDIVVATNSVIIKIYSAVNSWHK